jgi:hypothetical protein
MIEGSYTEFQLQSLREKIVMIKSLLILEIQKLSPIVVTFSTN